MVSSSSVALLVFPSFWNGTSLLTGGMDFPGDESDGEADDDDDEDIPDLAPDEDAPAAEEQAAE